MIWVAPWLDIMGGEVEGAESSERRTCGGRCPTGRAGATSTCRLGRRPSSDGRAVLAYFRQALLLGFYPGLQRGLLDQLHRLQPGPGPLQAVHAADQEDRPAGWRPVTYATPSDAAIYVERFDDQAGNTFYLTARTPCLHDQVLPDDRRRRLASTRAPERSPSRSSSATPPSRPPAPAPTSSSPTPSPPAKPPSTRSRPGGGNAAPNRPRRRCELARQRRLRVGNAGLPTGWTLGSALTDGNWSWDASTTPFGLAKREARRSGSLEHARARTSMSANFALTGGKSYTFSAWTKSSGVGGTYPPIVWLVELDSSGNILETTDRRERPAFAHRKLGLDRLDAGLGDVHDRSAMRPRLRLRQHLQGPRDSLDRRRSGEMK